MESTNLGVTDRPVRILRILRAALQLSEDERSLLASLIATEGKADQVKQISASLAPANLSPREYQVVAYVIAGHTSAEIAKKLQISESTIRGIRSRARIKLQARNNAELVRFALVAGIQPLRGEALA